MQGSKQLSMYIRVKYKLSQGGIIGSPLHASPAHKRPSLASTLHHTTTTTPPFHPGCSRGAAGAPLQAARPPHRDATVVRPRRRHRRPAAALDRRCRPQAAPEHLAAGRYLPWPSLPLPVLCPVGLRKMAVGRWIADQRSRLLPAQFDFSEKLLSPGQFYV